MKIFRIKLMLADWRKEMWNTGCMHCKASQSLRQAAWEETTTTIGNGPK